MDYLDPAGVQALLERLIVRTLSGESIWEPAGHEYEFKTRGKKYVYFIASGDRDDLAPHLLEVWTGDPTGEPLFVTDAVKLQTVVTLQGASHNALLRQLYDEAKRRALDIETVAAEILADFD